MAAEIILVGHRGQPVSYPENSLAGFRFVLDSGIKYIETDVQVTADGIAVLSHDKDLFKLTGEKLLLSKTNFSVFNKTPAGFSKRFDDAFQYCRISTLNDFSELLKNWDNVHCFVELKRASLKWFGNKLVDLVVNELSAVLQQSILISFDYDALVYAREKYSLPVAWVLPEWSPENQKKAALLSPEFLFIDMDFLPFLKTGLWQGDWQWVAYTANTLAEVQACVAHGISIIETDCFTELQSQLKNTQ